MGANIFAMPSSSIVLLFSVAFGLSNALPWAGAQETDVYRAHEFSPKPTGVPVDPARLFKRASVDVNVCGWVGGEQSNVARCGAGSSCIHDTIHRYIGCCATSGPCTDGVYTSCVDKNSDGWSSVQGMVNNGVLTCKESSACYRNTFPGDYLQYNCGKSNMAAQVQTTYAGQPKDTRLQVVYTGVNFSPMSAKPTTTTSLSGGVSSQGASPTASSSNTETPPGAAGKATPSATETSGQATGKAAATGDDKKKKTSAIAGGTVGGIAVLAAIAGVIFLLRRRQQKKQLRVGGFVSLHQKDQPPTSGPFQRIRPYSPEDYGSSNPSTHHEVAHMSSPNHDTTYVSPMTGHPDPSHQAIAPDQTDRDLLDSSPMMSPPSAGGFPLSLETATAVPMSRHNVNRTSPPPVQTHFPPPSHEEQRQPLVRSEIDDFSYGWHNAVATQGYAPEGYLHDRDTHIHSGDMPENTDVGMAGAVRRAASNLGGNRRTQDPNARSEAVRQADAENKAWSAQQLRAAQLADVGMGMGQRLSDIIPDSPPPRSPLREQVMQAFNAATRVGGAGDNSPVRYQLVDEGVPKGDHVQVLQGPGQLRGHRPRKSE